MGHIKEPKNIDLQIESSKVTESDKKAISEYIAKLKSEKKLKLKKSRRSNQYAE